MVRGFGVVDGDVEVAVDTGHGGMIEDGEALQRHVDPHLRVPVGEGEGFSRADMRKGSECRHRVHTPRVVACIEAGLGALGILDREGTGIEVGDELVKGSVGVLHERGLEWVGTDSLHCSAEFIEVDLFATSLIVSGEVGLATAVAPKCISRTPIRRIFSFIFITIIVQG